MGAHHEPTAEEVLQNHLGLGEPLTEEEVATIVNAGLAREDEVCLVGGFDAPGGRAVSDASITPQASEAYFLPTFERWPVAEGEGGQVHQW